MRWCNQCRSLQEVEEYRIIDWGEQADIGYEELCKNCGEVVNRVVYLKIVCDDCGSLLEFPVFPTDDTARMRFTHFCGCGKSTDYDLHKVMSEHNQNI